MEPDPPTSINLLYVCALLLGGALLYAWAYLHGLREGGRWHAFVTGADYEHMNPGKISQLLRALFCGRYYTARDAVLRNQRKNRETTT